MVLKGQTGTPKGEHLKIKRQLYPFLSHPGLIGPP